MKKKSSRLTRNLIEMGKDLRKVGLIDAEGKPQPLGEAAKRVTSTVTVEKKHKMA